MKDKMKTTKTSTTEVVVEAHGYIFILGMVTVGGMVID